MLNSTTCQSKTCSKCGQELPISEFHRRRHYVRSGHRAACKECTREATRIARIKNPVVIDLQKHKIRARTREAIRRHELTPLPCQVCGNLEVEAHHPHYSGGDAHMVVQWLCKKHHALEHGNRPWTNQLELFPAMA